MTADDAFLPQPSGYVPLKNEFYGFVAGID